MTDANKAENIIRAKAFNPKSRSQKRQEATLRDQACNQLSPQERLRLLDEKFGLGVGASKERARLLKKINF